VANDLVTKHILDACGGTIEGELIDVLAGLHETQTVSRAPVKLSMAEVRRQLGATLVPDGITSSLVHRFLTALGCKLTPRSGDIYEVALPSWRLDLTREIDLIEEVARVYGYNKFANSLPTPAEVIEHPVALAEHAVRTRLLALGFTEALSSTFASASESILFAPEMSAVPLENPLNEEAAYLRPSLLPGMVDMLSQNLSRDVLSVRLFETGVIFKGSAAAIFEMPSLVLGIAGGVAVPPLQIAETAPFYELKGAIEFLLSLFDLPAPSFTAEDLPPFFEPGRAAAFYAGGKILGVFGQLAGAEASRRKLRQPVWVAEINLAELLKAPLRTRTAREISRFQAAERDFSFVFPDSIYWGQLEAAIRALAIPELNAIEPVEIWRNAQKHPGVYSTLIRTTFQSLDRTLVDGELTQWSGRIIAALQTLGGTLRS
jgi:phenylalanyl-tRNA synthetase beta chain